jgi:WD40 repeat protein
LASAGLDGTVQLWDIRKFRDSRGKQSSKMPKPLAKQEVGLSINSSFFSPSGNSLLSTSFADRLDLMDNAHLKNGTIKPTKSIKHNNRTGRWLSTFMATWHPQQDIFVVGSMSKPRCMEVYDAHGKRLREVTGGVMTSVMSRCCFHQSADKLAMVGGNSSGRVVAIR